MKVSATISYDMYVEGLSDGVWPSLQQTIVFSAEHAFRKWRFMHHVMQPKALRHIVNTFVPLKRSTGVVGFGDWLTQGVTRGHPRVPLKALKRELEKRARVVYVDEFKTSQRCSSCTSQLEKCVFDDVKCYAVLRCTSCKTVCDRDVNAAHNIRCVTQTQLAGEERPAYLARSVQS